MVSLLTLLLIHVKMSMSVTMEHHVVLMPTAKTMMEVLSVNVILAGIVGLQMPNHVKMLTNVNSVHVLLQLIAVTSMVVSLVHAKLVSH